MSEFEDSIGWYELRWKPVLVNLLHFNPAAAESWIAKWRRHAEGNSMFYHESPMWFLSPLLLSAELKSRMPSNEFILVCGRLELILTQNTGISDFPNGVDWNALSQCLASEVAAVEAKYPA